MSALEINNDFSTLDEKDTMLLIATVREGLSHRMFSKIAAISPWSQKEWADFLHISERTLQRYQKEKKDFDPIHSEKILEIALLYKKGIETFGKASNFNYWLEAPNIALGGVKPKELLDNTFGIQLLKDELIRITHGIFA
ncbi:DUF2384 domain-containing protein [Cytophagales bacterium RKSG123]|nr:DUF2384 domain-containing protein [Xanthovirga aplysinae]